MGCVEGKIALITGGIGGIGHAIGTVKSYLQVSNSIG